MFLHPPVARLLRLSKRLAKQRSRFVAFVGGNRRALWKMSYFVIAALLFAAAAQKRFSWPQVPLADNDPGYLWPALMKLNGGAFGHIQGLNFLYPGVIYLILRAWGDFRAISAIQHLLGLVAGALFLASWSRLADFFSKPRLSRIAHEGIGLWGAAIYLLSNTPILLEMRIRPDALCMFFQALVFWLIIQFFYYRVISPDTLKAVIYGAGSAISAFLLASLKPSFTLMAAFAVAPVLWLVLNAKWNLRAKVAFFCITAPVVVGLTLAEHHLRRNDQAVKTFLPETLFAIHANIIQAQMASDLKNGKTGICPREWLQVACDDLKKEIERSRNLHPFPVLGFQPNYLMSGSDSLFGHWRAQLGEEAFLRFLHYWYWHSIVRRPLAFTEKIVRQLGVFYSTNCPAFHIYKKLPLSSWAYAAGVSVVSDSQTSRLLLYSQAGLDFLERTNRLRFAKIVFRQDKLVAVWNVLCARTYLAIFLLSVPLAGWFLLKRGGAEHSQWPSFLVVFLYSANFGNVLGLSVVHTMEVDRYSMVLFTTALLAQLYAIRWLLEIALMKLHRIKSQSRSARRVASGSSVPVRLTVKDFRIAHAGLWRGYSLSFRMAISLIVEQLGQCRPFALVFEQHQCFRQRSFGMANKQKAIQLRRTLPRPICDRSRRSCDRWCPI
jgi:hypothetical protein